MRAAGGSDTRDKVEITKLEIIRKEMTKPLVNLVTDQSGGPGTARNGEVEETARAEHMTENLTERLKRLRTMGEDEVTEDHKLMVYLRSQAETPGVTKKRLLDKATQAILEFESQRREAVELGLRMGEELEQFLQNNELAASLQEAREARTEDQARLEATLEELRTTKARLEASEREREEMQRRIEGTEQRVREEEDEEDEKEDDDELQRILATTRMKRALGATQRSRQAVQTRQGATRRSQSRGSERSARTGASEDETYKRLFIENMTSQALPPVPVFTDGFGLRGFSEFIDRLELKYKDLLGEDKLVVVLREHLGKQARAIFDSVTRGRKLSYSVIVRKMKERYRGDSLMQEYSATAKWENLRMREGENLTTFVLYLEQLAEQAFPGLPEDHLAPIMAKKLVAQLSHWRDYQDLLREMDHARKEMVYIQVKEAAIRMEMFQKRGERLGRRERKKEWPGESMRSERGRYDNGRKYENYRTQQYSNPQPRSDEQKKVTESISNTLRSLQRPNSDSVPLQSTPQQQTPVRATGGTGNGNQYGGTGEKKPFFGKCFNCQEQGHSQHYCTKPRRQNFVQREGTEKVEAREEGVEKKESSKEERLFWKPLSRVKVKLNGVTVEAILDCGSEVTTVPVEVMKKVEQEGPVEWRKTKDGEVLDAAASKLKITAKALITLEMEGERERIGVYVVQNGREVLLGQNTVAMWGKRDGWWSECEKEGEPAIMSHSVFIPSLGAAQVQLKSPLRGSRNMLVETTHGLSEGVVGEKGEGRILSVFNPFHHPIRLKKNEQVGNWVEADFVPSENLLGEREEEGESERAKKVLSQSRERESGERGQTVIEALQKNGTVGSERCRQVVEQFQDVFALSEEEMGRTTLVEHYVDTGDTAPIKIKQRPVPLGLQSEVKSKLDEMKERGIIRDSASPWSSPLVIALKKDKSLRLCVDYRKLNARIKMDAYPLPSIDMTLQKLKGKQWFSTLDLLSGYWQIPLEESSKEKTAFATMNGLYEWNVLPFGLSTSPATFQRVMERVLRNVLGEKVHVYIDDILIATESEEEHAAELEKVFRALRESGLKLKAQKCVLAQREAEYLGHRITVAGVQMDAAKVEKIRQQKQPSDRKELKCFLGMCSYYRKFVHCFAQKATPLTRLTSEKVAWTWGEQEERAFGEMKNALSSGPVLAQPDVDAAKRGLRPFIIYTDASKEAMGAVLSQEGEDGYLHPLYFASKRCSAAERNYHVTDGEALAIVFALRKFRPFYFGTRVIVRTDHQPLKAMFGNKSVSARILRWALEIQSSDVQIEYVKGAANNVADALSRSPVPIDQSDSERVEIERVVNSVRVGYQADEQRKGEKRVVMSVQLVGVRKRWREETEKDEKGSEMLKRVRESREQAVRERGLRWTEEKGILQVEGARGGKRFFVPETLRKETVGQWHEGRFGGHWSAEKIMKKLKEYYWEKMRKDVEEHVKECRVCEEFNVREKLVPPLNPILASEPFELVGFDILEVGTSLSGNRYILSIIDYFTKYGAALPMETKSAREVAEKFLSGWIAHGRMPKALISDQGGEFVNRIMEELLAKMGIEQIVTKGYNPRENGTVERFNQTIIRQMQKKVREPERWDELLPFIVFGYNTIPHSSTGETPFFLVHGRNPRPLGESLGEQENVGVDVDEYKARMLDGLRIAHEQARKNNEKAAEKMKKEYNDRNGIAGRQYPKVGDRVLVMVPAEKRTAAFPKLTSPWQGPFRVLDVSENSAKVKEENGKNELVIPFDQLKMVRREENKSEEGEKKQKRRKRMQRGMNIVYRKQYPTEWTGTVAWLVPNPWKRALEQRRDGTCIPYHGAAELLEVLRHLQQLKTRVVFIVIAWEEDKDWEWSGGVGKKMAAQLRRLNELAEEAKAEIIVCPDMPPEDISKGEQEEMETLAYVDWEGKRLTVVNTKTPAFGSTVPAYLLHGTRKRNQEIKEWCALRYIKEVARAIGVDLDFLKESGREDRAVRGFRGRPFGERKYGRGDFRGFGRGRGRGGFRGGGSSFFRPY